MSKSFRSARSPDTSAGAFDGRPARLARRPFPNSDSERRELARRSSAGVDVTLYWHPTLDELIVRVCDERHGAHFEIRPRVFTGADGIEERLDRAAQVRLHQAVGVGGLHAQRTREAERGGRLPRAHEADQDQAHCLMNPMRSS